MRVQWTKTLRGTFAAHVAAIAELELTILGGDDVWFWRVGRGEDDLEEGVENTLPAAKAVAEAAALRRLAEEEDDV